MLLSIGHTTKRCIYATESFSLMKYFLLNSVAFKECARFWMDLVQVSFKEKRRKMFKAEIYLHPYHLKPVEHALMLRNADV